MRENKEHKIKKNVVKLKNSLNPNNVISEKVNIKKKIKNNEIEKAIVVSQKQIQENLTNEIEIYDFKIKESKDTKEKKKLKEQLEYLKKLLRKELSKDLIISQIDFILNQMVKESNKQEQKELKEKIRILLKVYNEKNLKNAYDILNIESLDDIYSQDKGLRFTKDYKAFVYYFWSLETMAFRIIGINQIYPLFEILETQELFFLDKPTMTTLGKPVFWLVKGCPLSQQIVKTKDANEMSNNFTLMGYNSSQIKAMVRSPIFIRIFGLQKLSFKTITLIILLNIINTLICYIVFSSWYGF